ncbi:MAG: hypothetical protein JO253_03590 [Alphaproteobacteria bacterium]|nr:hypothetical protein [Alphaproteobacteria bacterium]
MNTALPATYANCFMYFAANVIASGVAAGMYYVVMSSTTAGTIYNNTLSTGQPEIPASPTAFSTTGPGAYTQSTSSNTTLLTVTVPGGSMGVNGEVRVETIVSCANNANTKNNGWQFAGNNVMNDSFSGAVGRGYNSTLRNRGVQTSQFGANGTGGDVASAYGNLRYLSVNTANNVSATLFVSLSTATDYIVLESYRVTTVLKQ